MENNKKVLNAVVDGFVGGGKSVFIAPLIKLINNESNIKTTDKKIKQPSNLVQKLIARTIKDII